MEILVNNIDKYNDGIEKNNKKEKINFTKNPKNNCIRLKKKMNKEYLTHKGQNHISKKNKKIFNSNKYYIYNVIYNKIFIMLNFFMIFFFISLSKQNPDVNELPKSEIIITINGPGIRSIFSEDFHYKPDIIFINENKTNLEEISEYNRFEMNKEENIIKVYYTNPPDNLRNMFVYNNNIKKIDFSHFDTSKVTDMNNMFSNCNEFGIY